MAKLVWDQTGERFYETGVKNCALYTKTGTNGAYATGVAWNGITAITESPSGAEANPLYADDIKYLNLISKEEFGATIEAYTYPEEFAVCDGSAEFGDGVTYGQQPRKEFGLAYITTLGNDEDGTDHGYKIHIIYNCLAAPSERAYATINDSPEAITFSWELSTTPVVFTVGTGADAVEKSTCHIEIDSTKVAAAKLTSIKETLFGTTNGDPTLMLPEDFVSLFA